MNFCPRNSESMIFFLRETKILIYKMSLTKIMRVVSSVQDFLKLFFDTSNLMENIL